MVMWKLLAIGRRYDTIVITILIFINGSLPKFTRWVCYCIVLFCVASMSEG